MSRIAIITLLWILLGFFYIWMKYSHDKTCCQEIRAEAGLPIDTIFTKEDTPYLFTNQLDTIIINDSMFSDFINSKLIDRLQGDTIQITGWQYPNEPEDYLDLNLGLHRAKIMAELLQELDVAPPFKLKSLMINNKNFKNHWFNPNILEVVSRVELETDKEIEDRQLIYHDYGSSDIIESDAAMQYLEALVARVIESGESIRLTGHTDHVGTQSFNYKLGLERAQRVANLIIEKGVPEDQVFVLSRGKEVPIAPINNDDLLINNRRTSIEIKHK